MAYLTDVQRQFPAIKPTNIAAIGPLRPSNGHIRTLTVSIPSRGEELTAETAHRRRAHRRVMPER